MSNTDTATTRHQIPAFGLPYAESGVDAEGLATKTCPVCGTVLRDTDHKAAGRRYAAHYEDEAAVEATEAETIALGERVGEIAAAIVRADEATDGPFAARTWADLHHEVDANLYIARAYQLAGLGDLDATDEEAMDVVNAATAYAEALLWDTGE